MLMRKFFLVVDTGTNVSKFSFSRIFPCLFLVLDCVFNGALAKPNKLSVSKSEGETDDSAYGTEFIIGFIEQ